jgi:peptide/nickel transport system permease protein
MARRSISTSAPRRRWGSFQSLGKRRPSMMIVPLTFLTVLLFLVITGGLLSPYDAGEQHLLSVLQPPGGKFLLGTDDLGRDVLSRALTGARSTVLGPLFVALGSMLIGNVLGLVSGYFGGGVDRIVMRWVDFMWSIPALFVAIVVVGVFGGGYKLAVIVLIVLYAPFDTRLIRGATLTQRKLPYIDAAHVLGLSPFSIMRRHLLPNVLPFTIANALLNFAYAMLSLAGLTFLGLGAAPGAADWGRMLAEGRGYMYDNPWLVVAPGILIVLTAVSVNLIGDYLLERYSDTGEVRT